MAIIFIPLLLIVLLETGLRLGGYGYPTAFFVAKQIQGKRRLVENADFGRRFFPPGLGRSPSPVVMDATKRAGNYRIFLFGESAAMGDPRPAYGAGRYLEVLLRERFPQAHFEVICTAMTAINSHAILPIAQECSRYEGDLWIVYMGNNEMAGPFGANTVFGARAPPLRFVRCSLALQRTRLGQAVLALYRKLKPDPISNQSWAGLKMFLDHQLPPHDPRKERVYETFQRNLSDIVRVGQRAQIPVLLSTVASNLKNCGPFGSAPLLATAPAEQTNLVEFCNAGGRALAGGDWRLAEDSYQNAVRLDPDSAEINFRLGQCALGLTNILAARHWFEAARDLDTLPFRTDTRLNEVIQRVAEQNRSKGVSFVDAAEQLARSSPAGIPGQEFFYEHVHLNPEGNYQLAHAWAEQIALLLPPKLRERSGSDWASAEVCGKRLGLTEWNRVTMLDEILQRLTDPPATGQCDHDAEVKQLTMSQRELRSAARQSSMENARQTYEEALRERPDDHWLHHNYAEFLTSTGDLAQATREMESVRELIPHHYSAYYQLGRLLSRQSRFEGARASLQAALHLRPEFPEAHVELGQLCARQGHLEQALEEYAIAKRLRPDDAGVYLRLAQILEELKRRTEAISCLREATRLRPDVWEPHHLLGIELALTGNFPEAEASFRRAVELRPDFSPGYVDLAMSLARQEKIDLAAEELRRALKLDPANPQAKQMLQAIQERPKP